MRAWKAWSGVWPARARGVRPVLVVVGAEGIQLSLEDGDGGRGSLLGQVALEGLVEALHLAAGLGVIWRRVLGGDAEPLELGLEEDLALAGLAAEDGAVVGEQCSGKPIG